MSMQCQNVTSLFVSVSVTVAFGFMEETLFLMHSELSAPFRSRPGDTAAFDQPQL